jgi:hypothetical protein
LNEKSALIEAEKANFPIDWMCGQLGVVRSSFYAWRERAGQVTATQARRQALGVEIERIFNEQRGTAGCRRIAAILNDEGHPASVGLVADLMRELGLAAIQRKAYKRTTVPDDKAQVFSDKLDRDFAPESHRPGEALVGDITYLRTGQGWLYLATVIDLATRKVIGWQTAEHMRASLVVDALEMARTQGGAASGAIFHSDHGSQGGFKWSSQHPVNREVCDGASSAGGGQGCTTEVEVSWASEVSASGGSGVLGSDRRRAPRGGGRRGDRGGSRGVHPVVPAKWRNAPIPFDVRHGETIVFLRA